MPPNTFCQETVQRDPLEKSLSDDDSQQSCKYQSDVLLVFTLIGVEDKSIGSFIRAAYFEQPTHLKVKDLLYGQVHPLPKHPSGIVHLFVIKLYLKLFSEINFFQLLDAAHEYIVSVDLNHLTAMFPVDP